MIAEAVSMEDFLESLENDVAIVTPPEAAARLFVVSDIHSDYEAQCRLCKVLVWWCRRSPPWPASWGWRCWLWLVLVSCRPELRPKLRILRRSTPGEHGVVPQPRRR